jgi:predicted SnoaL-like aldol condensation-catalyzing enzyme
VPTGRAGFVRFFSKYAMLKPVEVRMKAPLVSIVAEGDRVVLAFVHRERDPADSTRTYTTTSFDMFRIEGGQDRRALGRRSQGVAQGPARGNAAKACP